MDRQDIVALRDMGEIPDQLCQALLEHYDEMAAWKHRAEAALDALAKANDAREPRYYG